MRFSIQLLGRSFVSMLVLGAVLAGAPVGAGVVFQVETTYHSGSPGTESSEMSVEKGNLKMEIASGRSGDGSGRRDEAIFRGERREMVVVNHRDKSYMVFDGNVLAAVGGQLNAAMKQMEKQLEGLDPETRARIEDALKGKMPPGGAAPSRPVAEVRKTSDRAERGGYPTVRYDVLLGGEKVQELWVTSWSNLKGAGEMQEAFEDLAGFFHEMMETMGGGPGAASPLGSGDSLFEVFHEIDGFPVVTRNFEGGELESETVLESVTERDLDPDAFEPPKGYRLRTMGPQ